MFYDAVQLAAAKARAAIDLGDADASIDAWHDIFGDPFPERVRKQTAFTTPTAPAAMTKGHFA